MAVVYDVTTPVYPHPVEEAVVVYDVTTPVCPHQVVA